MEHGKISLILRKEEGVRKVDCLVISDQMGTTFQPIDGLKVGDKVHYDVKKTGDNTNFKNIKKEGDDYKPETTQIVGRLTTDESINRSVALKCAVKCVEQLVLSTALPAIDIVSEQTIKLAVEFEKWLNRPKDGE